MERVLCGLFVVLTLTGCGRSANSERANSPPRYETGRDVRDALVRSGLGCDDFQPVERHQRQFGEEDAVENDTCQVDNQNVSISTWASLGQKQDWARTRDTMGCQFAQSLGDPPPIYVDGGRWTVRVGSQMLADQISRAIGGQARFTDCRSTD